MRYGSLFCTRALEAHSKGAQLGGWRCLLVDSSIFCFLQGNFPSRLVGLGLGGFLLFKGCQHGVLREGIAVEPD